MGRERVALVLDVRAAARARAGAAARARRRPARPAGGAGGGRGRRLRGALLQPAPQGGAAPGGPRPPAPPDPRAGRPPRAQPAGAADGGPRARQVRFLFPVLPLLNIGAAAALARIVCRRAASPAARAAHAACCAALAAGFLLTLLMTAASRHNYPGGARACAPRHVTAHGPWRARPERSGRAGAALLRLHEAAAGAAAEAAAGAAAEAAAAGERLSVHIDTLPAMTGATRFFERGPPWAYSKARRPAAACLRPACTRTDGTPVFAPALGA